MSMKNFNDTIRNRTSDLATCSTVPQQTALPLNPTSIYVVFMVDEATLVQVFLRVPVLPSASVLLELSSIIVHSFIHSSTIDAIQF